MRENLTQSPLNLLLTQKSTTANDSLKKNLQLSSLLENVVEFVDPTGVSSWDDASRAYDKEDKGVVDYLDMAGAIPLAGKIGKIPRYAKQGFDLFKSGSKAAAATLGASRLLNFSDTASDIKEDNIKKK